MNPRQPCATILAWNVATPGQRLFPAVGITEPAVPGNARRIDISINKTE